MVNFDGLTNEGLAALAYECLERLHERQLAAFQTASCVCDDWSCWNCQQREKLKRGVRLAYDAVPQP